MKRIVLLLCLLLVACAPETGLVVTEPVVIEDFTATVPAPEMVASLAAPLLLPATATPWAYPTPIYIDVVEAPPPMPLLNREGIKVFALLGSDNLPHRKAPPLTDSIMLLFVDLENGRASLVSLPRDLHVFIPGYGMSRINTAYSRLGAQGVADTIRYNFGLEIDGYAYMKIDPLKAYIDNVLGGVTVTMNESVLDKCSGDIVLNYAPGIYTLNGATALCFARARMASSDYSRMFRQQELLIGLRDAMIAKAGEDIGQFAIETISFFKELGVETNLDAADIVGLMAYYPFDSWDDSPRGYRLMPPLVTHFDHPSTGAWLLAQPTNECKEQLIERVLDYDWWGAIAECPYE